MSPFLFSLAGNHIGKEALSTRVTTCLHIAIEEGERLTNDAYSPKDKYPERRYHALIAADHSYVGARDVMCEYHSIYALRDAVRQARRAHDPFVRFVVIVCEDFGGGPPHVMYKDRQHLLELNLQMELLVGAEHNPPVYLATYDGTTKEITGLWLTSVKEWLPFVKAKLKCHSGRLS